MSQNPYAPPTADVSSGAPRKRQRRPVGVWIVCALCVFGIVTALPALYFASRGALPMNAAATSFYQSFGVLNYVGVLVSVLLSGSLALSLFRLKASALHFAVALLVANSIKTILYLPQLQAMGQSVAGLVVGWGLGLLIVGYVWHLRRSGILSSRARGKVCNAQQAH